MVARLNLCLALFCYAAASVAQVDDDATLLELSQSLVFAAQQSDFAMAQPAMADSLQSCVSWIARSGAASLTTRDAARMATPVKLTLSQRLRLSPQDFALDGGGQAVDSEALGRYLDAVLEIVNTPGGLHDHLDAAVGSEQRAVKLQPAMELYSHLLSASLETSFIKLGRYERKFGPGSVRLNLLEVGLNMALSPVPGFGPDEQGWPGAWEAVAAYSTNWLGVRDSEVFAGSLLQLGLRHYNFAPGWGEQSSWRQLAQPSQFSFGAALAGEPDAPLIWPLRGEERWGAFAVWGSIQVAYLFGDEDRWLIGRQFQFLPALF